MEQLPAGAVLHTETYSNDTKMEEGHLVQGLREGEWKRWYPNGQMQQLTIYKAGKPANGWTSKSWYPGGALQEECSYSHAQLIEYKTYNEDGTIASHKVWNLRLKEMVDKPVQERVMKLNIYSSCHHMGFLVKYLPVISQFIGADYDEAQLLKAYDDFTESGEDEAHWELNGSRMRFSIHWERYEGYYFFSCLAPDEPTYLEAKTFFEKLRQEYDQK